MNNLKKYLKEEGFIPIGKIDEPSLVNIIQKILYGIDISCPPYVGEMIIVQSKRITSKNKSENYMIFQRIKKEYENQRF